MGAYVSLTSAPRRAHIHISRAGVAENDTPPRPITKKRAISARSRPLQTRHFRYIFEQCALSTRQGSTKSAVIRIHKTKILNAGCTAREITPDARAHAQIWMSFVTVSSRYEFSEILAARSRIITPHACRSAYISCLTFCFLAEYDFCAPPRGMYLATCGEST